MQVKKLKGFKFFPEFIKRLAKAAQTFSIPETTVIESATEHFLNLPEDKQREIIKKYLTKNL